MVEGTVFNIQQYSIHDGPGIRTTVFLKGCSLNCWWCHNPESMSREVEYTYDKDRCISCGDCDCKKCEGCYDVCVAGAIEMIGKTYSVDEIILEVLKDNVFYEESSGGVTISGGEPFVQIDFLLELLKEIKERNVHVAIDTSGFTSWENILKIIDYVDLFLYDLKHMDSEKHKLYTGVPNEIILNNLRKLSETDKDVWVRIPVIPGINDDDANIIASIEFIKNQNLRQIYLLPYHNIMNNKYQKLGMIYKLPEVIPPTDIRMEEIANMFKGNGLNVKIGG